MRVVWICALLLAAAAGSPAQDGGQRTGWLKKVPAGDSARTNPYAGQADAIAAGGNLFAGTCAKCHGAKAEGRHGRPALVSPRVSSATDGELAWLLKNGEPFRGMPSWAAMPEQERWEVIAWLRSRNNSEVGK